MSSSVCNTVSNQYYGLEIELKCNTFLAAPVYTIDIDSLQNPCSTRVIMSTKHACPVTESNSLADFIISFYYLIAIPCIAAGALLLVYGGRHPTLALFVMTISIVGTSILFVTYDVILPNMTPWWLVLFVIYFAYGNGAVLAFGSTMSPRLGVTICGVAFGFYTGLIIDLLIV